MAFITAVLTLIDNVVIAFCLADDCCLSFSGVVTN